ncbi:hypothetical protein AB0A05_07605 [Streptomyces sp. NPDC046374]|uniref:hypothetical protein n=1 Tax=Streptomyces sp. NPDC046374 TaxID=3154917 RepID=UPI0033C63E88
MSANEPSDSTPAAAYAVPKLSRIEVTIQARKDPRPANCPQCRNGNPAEHWPSGLTCQSSFLPNGFGVDTLTRVHCTCGRCF